MQPDTSRKSPCCISTCPSSRAALLLACRRSRAWWRLSLTRARMRGSRRLPRWSSTSQTEDMHTLDSCCKGVLTLSVQPTAGRCLLAANRPVPCLPVTLQTHATHPVLLPCDTGGASQCTLLSLRPCLGPLLCARLRPPFLLCSARLAPTHVASLLHGCTPLQQAAPTPGSFERSDMIQPPVLYQPAARHV